MDKVPQRSELLGRLIEGMTAGGIPAQQKGGLDQSFEARFRSFIHKIPSTLHSVNKKGFFPHFFLGGFSTLLDTQIAKKLDIKKIYFRFDTAETLKVVVIKNGQIRSTEDITNNINLFSISEGKHGHQFTSGELEKILQENTESGGLTKQDIKKEVKDRVKSKLIKISKGKRGISVSKEDKEILDSDTSNDFSEIKKEEEIWKDPEDEAKSKPEDYIAELAGPDSQAVSKSYKKIFKKIRQIHSRYEGSLTYAQGAREAAHHGFITGVFMNFRYRYHIRIGLEKLEGGGYVDIKLQVCDVDNSLDSFSAYIEVKASPPKELKKLKEGRTIENSRTSPEAALGQAVGYAQGSLNSLAFGVNLDYPSPISDVVVVNQEERVVSLFEGQLRSLNDWHIGRIDEEELKERIKGDLEHVYLRFPGTPEKRNHHYFSRFLLGQLIPLNKVAALRTKFEKHIFIYGENIPTEIRLKGKDRSIPQRKVAKEADEKLAELAVFDESHAVVTMVLIPKDTEEPIYVMHIVEADRKGVLNKKLPLDKLGKEIKDREIVELTFNFNVVLKGRGAGSKFEFEKHFSMEANKYPSLEHYNGVGNVVFQGAFQEMPYSDGLQEAFGEAIDSKLIDSQDQPVLVDKYDELFKKIGKGIFPCKFLIKSESHTQAVIDGLFQYYRDLRLSEVSVSTEFQLGEGKRIDMFVNVGGVGMGIEFKGPRGNVAVGVLEKEARTQVSEYEEGDYSIAGVKKAFLRAYIFDARTKDASSLIVRVNDEAGSPLEKIVEVIYSSQEYKVSVDKQSTRKRQKTSKFQVGCSSSKRRKTRSAGVSCIDSRDEESVEERDRKEKLVSELFDRDKIREIKENFEFYNQLFEISDQISKGGTINEDARKALKAKVKDIDLNLIDPEIKGIVAEIKNKISRENANEGLEAILRESGVAEKIGKVAEGAGLAFTAFLVGKHIANGNIEGLGYDALNLLIMPKIGEKISGKILELGTKLDSQMLKGFAPVMGRAIGNFAAFLGLAESIKARQNAKDPVDIKIADLNIATNSIFIAADVPAVVTETMSAIGMEARVIGEFTGPAGAAVSVAVIVISQFVEAGLEVQKLEEQINLTDQEKHDLYWRFFLGMKIPDYIERDITAKAIYKGYISHVIDSLQGKYDVIAMTLPAIRIKQEKNIHAKDVPLMFISAGAPSTECKSETRITDEELDFALNVNVNLSNVSHTGDYSRVIPDTIKGYDIFCGPRDSDIRTQVVKMHEHNYPSFESCDDYFKDHDDGKDSQTTKRWFFQKYSPDCNNVAVYSSRGSSEHKSIYCITSQNAKIYPYGNDNSTVAFHGREISVLSPERDRNVSNSTENRYYFSQRLRNCTVHKPGNNFFYITGNEFSCNLKREGQKNIVVTQGNFTDSENIHSIVGNNGTNHVEVSYAGYVDGQGGNDVITAKNSPVIKGYFGDNIYGKGVTVLPIALRDISKMILEGDRNTIYSKDGNLTIHGKEMLMKTRDGFFVTATKINSRTKMVTDLHVVNYNGTEVFEVCDDSIQELILYVLNGLAFGEGFKNVGFHFMHKLFNGTHLHKNASGSVFADNPPLIIALALEGKFPSNPNFKTTRQMFSKKLDVVIGDYGHHVFYADRQSHFFYWEGAKNVPNLYLFDDKNVTVIINKGNGLLDFSMVESEEKYKVEVEEDAVFIVKSNVRAVLTMNYKNITVTFDQKEYYKLQGGKLERDYCSHRLKIDESFRVNSTDLLNYNCLTFDTDKVFFLRLGNDLQLVSNKEALSILDYYKPDSDAPCTNDLLYAMGREECANSLDLSIELSNRIIEREEFRKRADNPSTFKYYEPGEVRLKIYHNQPVNKNDVGLVNLKGKFILDLDMEIIDDSLFLLHKNNTLVKVENWNTYQPAREMMFVFNDGVVLNAKCIVSSFGPEDTIREFQEKKVGFLNEYLLKAAENGNLDRVKYLLSRGAYIDARDHKGITPLYFSCSKNHLDVVEFLLDQGANANAVANTWTPLQTATAHGFLKIVQLILSKRDDVNVEGALEVVGYFSKKNELKIKNLLEERIRGNEETIQHHIRHKRHKQHHRKHLQEKGKTDAYRHRIIENDSSAIESNQATSGASKPSSWINVFANSVVDAVKSIRQFIFSSFKPAIDMQTSRVITTEGTDVNGTILLLDVFIRKFTGQKYISSNTGGITEQEALGYVLSVTEKFREVVEQAALKSSISIHRLNIDFMKMQEEITGKIISGKFNEISEILKSYAEKACPSREAGCSGRLSQKKFDKFMTEFNSMIDPVINQSMQQILSRESMLKASNVKEQEISLKPKSYLNGTSVQCHLTKNRSLRNQGGALIP